MAPQGVISYISSAWGGCVSDKYLTEHSGILTKLLLGDWLIVGLTLPILLVHLETSYTYQLIQKAIYSIANVRIHFECVSANFYRNNMVTKRTGEECPLIDRIARVCCALCNVCRAVGRIVGRPWAPR